MHLRAEFGRLGIDTPFDHDAGLCTMRAAGRARLSSGRSLIDCCAAAGLPDRSWHTALDDARVGAQSLVAAGSLISPGTIIPPRSLVMGMPARVKRPLSEEEVAGLDAYWKNYVEYSEAYRREGSNET